MTLDDLDARIGRAAKTLAAQQRREAVAADALVTAAEYRAGATPVTRTGRRLVAVAAAVAVVGAGVLAYGIAREQGTAVTSTPLTTVPEPSIVGSEVAHVPVFTAEGEPREVAKAYLRIRFPDFPAPGVKIDGVETTFPTAVVRWSTNDSNDSEGSKIAAGSIELRRGPKAWSVVRSTTDGTEFHVAVTADGRLTGTVESSSINTLAVDVLDLQGSPVPGSPHPEGFSPDSNYRFGTAGVSPGQLPGRTDATGVDVDVPSLAAPMLVRAQHVGGTMLSIAEFIVDPRPEGAVLREGTWAGGEWKIRTSDSVRGISGSPCGWVEVNGLRDEATCDGGETPPRTLRRAGAFEEHLLYFAYYGNDVHKVRLEPERGEPVEVDTVPLPEDPLGPRMAVLAVSGTEGFSVRLFDESGELIHPRPPELQFPASIPDLDVELIVRPHGDGVFLDVRLRSRPTADAEWLVVLIDGQVASASMPLVVASTVGTSIGPGAKQVQVVAATVDGTVVATVAASIDALPVLGE